MPNSESVDGDDPHKFLTLDVEVSPENRKQFKEAQDHLFKDERIHPIITLIQNRIILDERQKFEKTMPSDIDKEDKQKAEMDYRIFTEHIMPRFKGYAGYGDILAAEVAKNKYTVGSIIEPYVQWLIGKALEEGLLTSEDCEGLGISLAKQ